MNRRYMASGHTSVADAPKLKTVVAEEDAAALSTNCKTCTDIFGSCVLAAWSCKDSWRDYVLHDSPGDPLVSSLCVFVPIATNEVHSKHNLGE